MTESVETTTFTRITPGMRISMPVSNRFVGNSVSGKAGYCYVNIPWVSNYEWHSFSMFEDPNDRNVQQVFIMSNGNWTEKLVRLSFILLNMLHHVLGVSYHLHIPS